MSTDSTLPRALHPFRGSIPLALARGAAAGLGAWGECARDALDRELVPLDILTGMSLFLLANQPRAVEARRTGGADEPKKAKRPLSGGVWVREQVTIHRPFTLDQQVVIAGETARRFSLRGRRYGVTTSQTRDTAGRLLVSNCTTGLLRYRKEEGLVDAEEGRPESELPHRAADSSCAHENPALAALRDLTPGDRIEHDPIQVTLAMMLARDSGRGENPIHTDPEVARKEGLAAPIAGGSHVLSFLQEVVMQRLGGDALRYGAHFDVSWKAQVFADSRIVPSAVVESVSSERVLLSLRIEGDERTAMTGTLSIPLGDESA